MNVQARSREGKPLGSKYATSFKDVGHKVGEFTQSILNGRMKEVAPDVNKEIGYIDVYQGDEIILTLIVPRKHPSEQARSVTIQETTIARAAKRDAYAGGVVPESRSVPLAVPVLSQETNYDDANERSRKADIARRLRQNQ